MNILKPTNSFLEKWIFMILPLLMFFGILSGEFLEHLTILTPYLFMVLTFISSFSADWRKFSYFITKPWLFIVMTLVLQLIIPFFTLIVVGKVFPGEPDLIVGITLTMMLPIGVTSIFWVGFAQGNVTMALSLVSLNTLLSPFIIPATFYLMLDSVVQLDTGNLVLSLLKLVLIPSALGMVVGEWIRKKKPSPIFITASSLISKICLYLVVLFNAASISSNLELVSDKIVHLVIVLFSLMAAGYLIHFGLSMLFTQDLENRISVAYSGGIRNYTVGVVLATTFFTPLVAFPVLLAMLLQHPIAMLFNIFFNIIKRNKRPKLDVSYESRFKV
ncbi:bile acid:sodium symporter family protein [Metabacillus sp. Hm71]|uniref:bile acid:sodium symporter family protein n=1 Tax=Metabacillus sp. Hm71 TaxID=3450743 RepID=UPI003F4425C1